MIISLIALAVVVIVFGIATIGSASQICDSWAIEPMHMREVESGDE